MVVFVSETWPIILFLVGLIAAFLAAQFLLRPRRMPYQRRSSLLTKSELKFYEQLRDAVEGRWAIMAMVRMADILRVEKGNRKFQSWQNRIQAKHIDFVLCNHETMEIVLAIELDDTSHQRPDRKERDIFVNGAFDDAGIRLLRVPIADDYDVKRLRKTLQSNANR